jgi:hypothetical protein
MRREHAGDRTKVCVSVDQARDEVAPAPVDLRLAGDSCAAHLGNAPIFDLHIGMLEGRGTLGRHYRDIGDYQASVTRLSDDATRKHASRKHDDEKADRAPCQCACRSAVPAAHC